MNHVRAYRIISASDNNIPKTPAYIIKAQGKRDSDFSSGFLLDYVKVVVPDIAKFHIRDIPQPLGGDLRQQHGTCSESFLGGDYCWRSIVGCTYGNDSGIAEHDDCSHRTSRPSWNGVRIIQFVEWTGITDSQSGGRIVVGHLGFSFYIFCWRDDLCTDVDSDSVCP